MSLGDSPAAAATVLGRVVPTSVPADADGTGQHHHAGEVLRTVETLVRRLYHCTYRRRMATSGSAAGEAGTAGAGAVTCDTGWGCMIRSAQMMLAHALHRAAVGDGAAARGGWVSACARRC